MAKKKKEQQAKKEKPGDTGKIYVVPFAKVYQKPRPKRAPKAITALKLFVKKHTRIPEKNILVSPKLNQKIWSCGREHIPRKIEVRVVIDDGKANVFLAHEKIAATKKEETKKEEKKELTPEQKKKEAEQKAKREEKKAKEKAIEKAAIKRGSQ